jgi:predicted nucleotidyltransferase
MEQMLDALEFLGARRTEVESLCRAYALKRLRLFGSAVKRSWNPATSDYDFVVEVHPVSPSMRPFDQYSKFKVGLETVLGRPVDIVELAAVRNDYFLRNLERTALDRYAA